MFLFISDPDYLNAYMCENLNNTEAAATVAQTPELEDQAPEAEDQALEPEECSARGMQKNFAELNTIFIILLILYMHTNIYYVHFTDGNTFDWDKKNTHLLLNSYQQRLQKFRDPKFRKIYGRK